MSKPRLPWTNPEASRRRWRAIFASACIAVIGAGEAVAANRVRTAALTTAPGGTRIEVESDTAVRFNLFSLRNPERVVLDLDGVDLDPALQSLPSGIAAGHPYVRSLTVRVPQPRRVRIEIDLKEEVEARISTVAPPAASRHRLVLDLVPERAGAEVAVATPAPAPQPDAEPPAQEGLEEALLAVSVNGQAATTTVALRRRDGRLLLPAEELRRWRLRHPRDAGVHRDGVSYHALESLRGISYQVDPPTQALHITASPGAFEATAVRGAAAAGAIPPASPPGGFVNYEASVERSSGRTTQSGLIEAGAFRGAGVAVTTVGARELDGRLRGVRLETTFTHDRPADLASLRVGDAVGRAGDWGRAVRFGGVQWSTNFSMQPGFVPFPLPGLSGEAALPSTVDVFVNGMLRMRRDVPAGPFSIHDLPVITGRGEARLLVRDALGRTHVITQPYYVSPRLLQEGLHDYSYEAGWVRENFGIASADYGRAFAAGTHRYGLDDRITLEGRAEIARGHRAAGAGLAYLQPALGVASASIAASDSARGQGALMALGFERQGTRVSIGASVQLASRHFAQLGLPPGELAARRVAQGFVGLAAGGHGSLTVAYAERDFRDRDDVRLLTASYGLGLGRYGYLTLSVTRVLAGDDDTFVGLSFTLPLDPRTSANLGVTHQNGRNQAQLQVQRSLPAGTGSGYRALASFGEAPRQEAALAFQNEIGTYSLEAARTRSGNGYRASASGGIAVLDGGVFASRRIFDSFAVASVPGYANVRVYADNQLVGRTSARGNVLVPRLLPYTRTSVRIEQADLPLDVEIAAAQLEAYPYFRSGALLRFPVKRSNGATLTLLLEDGTPLPAGALVRVAGQETEHPVGLRGEAYVTGLGDHNRLTAHWRGQSCHLVVPSPLSTDPLPNLGTFTCAGVRK